MRKFVDQIRFLVMDVDGTLTDGKINIGDSGELFKSFDVKDGCGIKIMLPRLGIVPVVITARKSAALGARCHELGITEVHQGISDKLSKLNEIIAEHSSKDSSSYSLSNVAYLGDDVPDILCMSSIGRAGGLSACPSDATDEAKSVSGYICIKGGGSGAVRELIDLIAKMRSSEALESVKALSVPAYEFIASFNPGLMCDGVYDLGGGVYANVLTYTTADALLTCCEAHRRYIDVQFMVYGEELMVTEQVSDLQGRISVPYDEEKDVVLFDGFMGARKVLGPGDVAVLYPEDAHRGAITTGRMVRVRKIVVKVPV